MAARDDILEKLKKSREEANRRIQENNQKAAEQQKASREEYEKNTSASTKQAASYMQKYSTPSAPVSSAPETPAKTGATTTKWYKGSQPTEIETLARIAQISKEDEAKGRDLYGKYQQFKGQGMWAETYDKPTSTYMTSLGLTPDQVNEDFFLQALPEMQAGTLTAAGNQSSSKKNKLAYELDALKADWQKTVELQNEEAEIMKAAQFWMSQGYTDDEIKAKINDGFANGDYKKLAAAMEKTKTGEVEPTTAPIQLLTSYGLDGMIFALRNPGMDSGDYKTNAVKAQLGQGVKGPEQSDERRNVASPYYAPYAVGMTGMDEYGIKYGVTEFTKEWLESPAGQAVRNNPKTAKEYSHIWDVVNKTEEYKIAVDDFVKAVSSFMEAGMSPDEIFTDSVLESYPEVKKLYEAQQKGVPVETANAVGLDMRALYEQAVKSYTDTVGKVSAEDYDSDISEKLGAPSARNTATAGVQTQTNEQLREARSIFAPYATDKEKEYLLTTDGAYATTKQNVQNGILSGTSEDDQAFHSAMDAADKYAAAEYLPAKKKIKQLQSDLDAFERHEAFLAKWEPRLDSEGPSVLASDEFKAAESADAGDKEVWEKYHGDATGLKDAIAAEEQTLTKINGMYSDAALLNVNEANGSSIMPMLEFVEQFDAYVPQRFADTEWGYRASQGESWENVSKSLDERRANNTYLLKMIDTAIAQAEKFGIGGEYIDGMKRARQSIEDENKLIAYDKLRDQDDFSSVVNAFNSTQVVAKPKPFSKPPSREEAIRSCVIDPTAITSLGGSAAAKEDIAAQAQMMSESEKNTYKYIYMTKGEAEAAAYFDTLAPMLNVRKSEEFQQRADDNVDTWYGAAGANLASVAINVLGSLPTLAAAAVESVGGDIDPYSSPFWFHHYSQTAREETKNNISSLTEDKFGKDSWPSKLALYGYEAVMTGLDSAAAGMAGGSAGALLLSGNSAVSSLMDAKMRGADDWQAWAYAGVNAAAEYFTEKLPMEKLLGITDGSVKTYLKRFIEGVGVDAPGEMLSEAISQVSDQLIMQELSNWNAAYNQYRESEMSDTEARKQSIKEFWTSIGYAGLLSVGTTGASTAAKSFSVKLFGDKNKGLKSRAETALSEAAATSVGKSGQTATVAAVMEAMGGDSVESEAAAHALVQVDPDAANTLHSILVHTEDPDVLDAVRFASLVPDSVSGEMLKDIRSGGATDENVQKFIETAKLEQDDPELQATYDQAVVDGIEAAATVEAMLGVDKSAIKSAEEAVYAAKKNLEKQTKELSDADSEMQAATSAMENAKKRFKAKPSDPKAKNALSKSVARYQAAQTSLENVRATTDIAKANRDLKTANEHLTSTRNAALTTARLTAQDVAKQALDQRAAETAQKAEAAKQAEAATAWSPEAGTLQNVLATNEEAKALDAQIKELSAQRQKLIASITTEEWADPANPKKKQEAEMENQIHELQTRLDDLINRIVPASMRAAEEKMLEAKQKRDAARKKAQNGGGYHAYRPYYKADDEYRSARFAYKAEVRNYNKSLPTQAPVQSSEPTPAQPTTVAAEAAPFAETVAPSATAPVAPAPQMESAPAATPVIAPAPSGMGVSQFAGQTGQNTQVLSDKVKKELRESPYYQKTSQQANVDQAIAAIEREGYETRKSKLLDGTTNLFSPAGQAEAFVLARAAKEAGDVNGESAIAFKVKESGTVLGQSLAMRALYVSMTPEGKMQYVQRIVDQINQGYENRKSDTRVTAPEWLAERLRAVEGDDDATANVLNEAYAAIAEQMLPDWRSRLNAWRYMAMLANPKTHIKNLLGNGVFVPVVGAKNRLGALMELGMDQSKRTKTFGPIKAEYKDFAKSKLAELNGALTGGGKHNPMDIIQEKRRSFDSKLLEYLSKGNGKLLEKEDAFFLNYHFVHSFAGFLQARGVDVNNIDKATLNEGLDYAIGEAQKATFRDASEVADKISKFSRDLNNSKGVAGRTAGVLVEGALPFKKTPINIMKRGIEYSPVGLISTLATWQKAIETNSATQAEIFDRLASGLTGTAISLIGGMLWKTGALKLNLDDPEDELEKLQGSQEYSIELFGKSVTIDWMSPAAMPLFVGGAIAKLMSGGQEELNLNTLGEALMNIAEPVFNLSMLDGVNSLLSAASNSENGVVDLAVRAGESYASQFVPTVLGAFARLFDETRRTTYTDKNIGVPAWAQYMLDSTINKIPGASHTGQPYLNAWGEEDVTKSFWGRALENFVSPGYINSLDVDDVETHLMELFDATGETGLIPGTPQKFFTVQGERIDLTGEQYEQLTKERGQLAKKLHEELFADETFMALEPKYQVKALESVWDYTTALAKSHIDERVEVPSWATSSTNVAAALLETMDEAQLTDKKNSYKKEMYSAISAEDPETAATCVAELKELGAKPSDIKTSVTDKYKQEYRDLYAAGDIAGMRELENTLVMLGIGYKHSEFVNWLK